MVSAGSSHSCGLREGGVVECWGYNLFSQGDSPEGAFSVVSAGELHSCGVRESGEVACWGRNLYGQMDAPGGVFSTVSAGAYHTCGLRENGQVECWGYTFDGQAQPPAGKQIAVSAGYDYACALSETGAVSCWMIYNGAADVPAWLREPAMPITGSGGLLDSGPNRQKIALAAFAGLSMSVLSLLVLLALQRGRALR